MKKTLLALAVLGAFAGVASAQSSVTVYGLVDTSISSIDNGKGRIVGIDSGNNGASRIGFKGTENLGNGMKAEFVLENGINTDNGTGGAGFSRLSYVGLGSNLGTVRLGKQNTQVKEMLGEIDPFGAAGIVNSVDYINGGGLNQRVGNQITYTSNKYSGFSATVGYIFGEKTGDTEASSAYGLRLGYNNGPLNVQFGYSNENNATVGAANADLSDALIGATYNFGAFKLHGILGERSADANFTGTAAAYKYRSALIGATVPFGASKIRAEYIRNDKRNTTNADNNVFALSYSYDMSKRTSLYATYVRISNDSTSDLGIGGPGEGTAGKKSDALALGIAHKF